MIELKRNPLGAPVRQARGIVPMRVHNDATSLNDKLRIANKVNSKYLESKAEKSKLLEDLESELGSEDTNTLVVSLAKTNGKIAAPGAGMEVSPSV